MPGLLRASLDNPYGPQVTFRTEDVLPPTALYLSMDDTLLGQIITSATGLTFTLTVRMLLPDGTLKVEAYQSTPSPFNAAYYDLLLPPVEGYILSCLLQLGGIIDGSAWARLIAFKGSVTPPIAVFPPVAGIMLIQGYVDEVTSLSWPDSPLVEAGMGAGRMRNIMPSPAAGANMVLKTSSVQRWELIALTFNLHTSAVVNNRQVSLLLFDRLNNVMCRFPTNFTQAANLTYAYYFYENATHIQTQALWITAPFPAGVLLDPGMSLQSSIVFLDPGDSLTNVSVLVREWMGVGHN